MPSLIARICVIAAVVLVPVASLRAQTDSQLRDLAEQYWEADLKRHPSFATSIGDYRYNDRLDDLSADSARKWEAEIRSLQQRLRRVQPGRLCQEDRLTLDLLDQALACELLRVAAEDRLTPLEPLFGPHLRLPLLLVSQPFRNAQDYRDYIARLRAFPSQVDQIITNMRQGSALGQTTPRIIVEKVIPQIRAHLVADVTESAFYKTPFAKASVLSPEDRRTILADLADAISGDVIPAYWQLLAFVEDEYLQTCRETVGLSALPKGDRRYVALAFLHTTLRTAPQRIHEIGLEEVARIREEMMRVKTLIGFEGSLEGFLEHLRTDPKYRAGSADELLETYRAILDRTKPLMSRLFNRLPQADCVMKELESYRTASAPMAFYNPAPQDGSRPGYFYVNTYAPLERVLFCAEALTYHEAIPGHHIQFSLAQENKDVPKFRRFARITAYEEGWALYAETLGKEIGGYQDSYQEFGRLNFQMWRACRLVVDTGIHLMGWTRAQAIDYLLRNTALPRLDIEAEVDRYIVWPGQALGYKLGELRIREIREKAERELGARFDLRAFHDEILSGGPVPLSILEQIMDRWIAAWKK